MDEYRQLEAFYLDVLHVQNKSLLKQMCEASSIVQVVRNKTLFCMGDVVPTLYFLVEGGLRFYYYDKKGHEVTDSIWFRTGDTVAPGFHPNEPSLGTAVAFCDSTLVAVPWVQLMQAISRNFEGRDIYERILIEASDQHCMFKAFVLNGSVQERYAWFLRNYSGLEGQISDRCIASFLRMSPITLSRLHTQFDMARNAGEGGVLSSGEEADENDGDKSEPAEE